MPNGRRVAGYVPKMTDCEALELCSPFLRWALCNSFGDFNAINAYKWEKKHGTAAALSLVKLWNQEEAKRPWIRGRGKHTPPVQNSYIAEGVKLLGILI